MVRNLLRPLGRAAFRPGTLPPAAITAIAITPAVLAGLLIFRSVAVEMLLLAGVVGGTAHLAARLLRLPIPISPVLPAVVAVGLVGPGAPIHWSLAMAAAASLLELLRARFVPAARIEIGLVAYAILFFAGRGAVAAYTVPGTTYAASEPIRLWMTYYGDWRVPVDPVRLYVGNVPGPIFATSLVAVAIGAAWLWYARRLSLFALAAFLVGAVVPIVAYHWSPSFQLVSGPLWFGIALVLGDRRLLPGNVVGRALAGLVAGVAILGSRNRAFSIETTFIVVAAIQVALAAAQGMAWLAGNRRQVWAAARSRSSAGASLRTTRRPGTG